MECKIQNVRVRDVPASASPVTVTSSTDDDLDKTEALCLDFLLPIKYGNFVGKLKQFGSERFL